MRTCKFGHNHNALCGNKSQVWQVVVLLPPSSVMQNFNLFDSVLLVEQTDISKIGFSYLMKLSREENEVSYSFLRTRAVIR